MFSRVLYLFWRSLEEVLEQNFCYHHGNRAASSLASNHSAILIAVYLKSRLGGGGGACAPSPISVQLRLGRV